MIFSGAIEIDKEKCDGCGECISVCPSDVYEIKNGKTEPVNLQDCIECCACVEVCPAGCNYP